MMGYLFLSSSFLLLYRIIKEKIYQNGIDLGIWVISDNLSTNQFHTPYTTTYTSVSKNPSLQDITQTSQLDFPRMATFYQLLLANGIIQEWTIPKTSKTIQNLRYPVIRKNGDFVNVIKLTKPLALKRRPQISNTDLSPFEKPHTLPIFEPKNVIKAGEVLCKEVD